MARLSRIRMTPVKGTSLQEPESVELTPAGIPENRRFYLIDDRGELFSSFEHGPLQAIVPTYAPETEQLTLRFPDGDEVRGDAGEIGEPVSTNFHGRAVDGRLVDGPWSERISTYVGRPLRLVRTDRDGDGSDVEHLTIVSSSSVGDLARRGRHEGPLDPRRFRIDLEFDEMEAFEEDTWQGRDVGIGDAGVRVLGQIPRCRVTTLDPLTGLRDWNTLTQIARFRPRIKNGGGIPFGMYARVIQPARIHVGDAVLVR